MRSILQDFLYAARVLRRTPTLTLVAVLTLALGIAATTTIFGWIDGMVLHPFHGASDDGQLAVDVSALKEVLPSALSAIGPVSVKYEARNPANSIVVSEQWSGVRASKVG